MENRMLSKKRTLRERETLIKKPKMNGKPQTVM